uniref:Transthyretin-like family protein n=1 Tax=Panagrellus redivivus TaxID=6233 RepID=A0A7E4UQQ2_PANRE
MLPILSTVLTIFVITTTVTASTECVWATGKIACLKNQTLVVGATVELFDLDSPQNSRIKNPLDPDDKVAFTTVEDSDGIFSIEGCASDVDWIPGIKNLPEMYFRVFHYCNKPQGEYKTVLPIWRVFVPKTYDKHINDPIILDD